MSEHSRVLPALNSQIMYLQLKILMIICVSTINGMDGGPRAGVGEFKYMVSIWNHEAPLCGGAIIHKRHILTAAHCTFDEPAYNLFVYAGLIDLEDPNLIVRNVKKVHPYYGTETIVIPNPDRFFLKNDLAILEIEIEFTWSSTIGRIPLPETEYWNPCEPCLVPGWDAPREGGRTAIYLLSVYASVYDDQICRNYRITLFPNEKCAHDDFGDTIAVRGDSGSPFVCGGVASGIIVRGHTLPNRPTVILSVYPYRQFIYQVIRDDKKDADPRVFPYVVSIWNGDNYICGGMIFDDLHVITMANRIKSLKKDDLKVLAGKHAIPGTHSEGVLSSVDGADLYLHYEKDISDFAQKNIAVLKLTRPLLFTPVIREASLSAGIDLRPGQVCQVLQWSRTNEWETMSRKLVWSPAVILSKQRCEESGSSLGSNEFCATSVHEFPLAFEEDCGNPIVCQGIVVGILASVPRTFSLFAPSRATFIQLSPYVDTIEHTNVDI